MTYEEAFIYVIQGRRFVRKNYYFDEYLLPCIDEYHTNGKIKCIDFLNKRNLYVDYFYVGKHENLLTRDTFQENIKCL